MKVRHLFPVLCFSFLLGLGFNACAQDTIGPYEQQVVDAVNAYVDAYNKRNAKAVSLLWASNGEFTDADGNHIVGREKIQEALNEKFQEMPDDSLLSVTINKISFVTKDVAVEEGIADIAGEQSSYTAVHKKEDGQWRLHSVRETVIPSEPAANSKLMELEWLVGEWVDQSEEVIARTSCRWSKNKNFLISNFKVEMPDSDPLEGTQVIGFDATKNCIRSWTFDSNGGISQATWKRKDNQWMVRVKYLLKDGGTGSSVNVFTKKDDNEYTWESTQRKMGNESRDDVGPVKVVKLKDESDE